MAEEYNNGGKKDRWASGMRRISNEAQSIYNDLDRMPSSESEERDYQRRIESSMRNLQRMIDSFISQDLY